MSFTMSGMVSRDQTGSINVLLLPLISAVLLLIAALSFGGWAYAGRQDYKNNVDKKVAVAVTAAKEQQSKADEADFAERIKSPLKSYTGPSEYGSVVMQYPKTWSGYVSVSDGDPLLNGYFSPGVVPDVRNESSVFALHVQVVQDSYNEVLEQYSGDVEEGAVTARPYALPKLANVVGTRLEGRITDQKTGVVVVLPLRDKTLEISTEADQFKADFDNIILANFVFSP